jgi:hypothetical protein
MRVLFAISLLAGLTSATTLQYLSLDDMAQKSTSIVRGRVQNCLGQFRGPVIYTHCQVVVTEQWKGTSSPSAVNVAVMGGTATDAGGNRMVQNFPGAPQLAVGQEYVLFLWAGKSGLTQIIGFSQGVFDLKTLSLNSAVTAVRPAANGPMLGPDGMPVTPEAIEMGVGQLKARVARALATGAGVASK